MVFFINLEAFVFHACRCVILSFDDGSIRLLSLIKAAYEVPAAGKPYAGTKQPELNLVSCSSFAVWSVQASQLTGISINGIA